MTFDSVACIALVPVYACIYSCLSTKVCCTWMHTRMHITYWSAGVAMIHIRVFNALSLQSLDMPYITKQFIQSPPVGTLDSPVEYRDKKWPTRYTTESIFSMFLVFNKNRFSKKSC